MAKMGFQLSSITPYLGIPESLRQSFRTLAEIGYRDIQLQGVPMEIQDDYIARALADAGLNCVATQEDYSFGFGADPQRAIARAVRCAAKYLCCALIPLEVDTPQKLRQFSENLASLQKRCRPRG